MEATTTNPLKEFRKQHGQSEDQRTFFHDAEAVR